jgi:hypothetical protein
MNPKWSTKFELKPGKWVFVPTREMAKFGKEIKLAIEGWWAPPPYFYHLRAGGHVAALKAHLGHSMFLRLDVQDFFGSVSRTRVTRCLKKKFGYEKAREWANASTVTHPSHAKRTMLPFGFVQSPILASLCLAKSSLGSCLSKVYRNKDLAVSVYVDDIILSSRRPDVLDEGFLGGLRTAAERARFAFSAEKAQGPSPTIKAFNIELCKESVRIDEERMKAFVEALNKSESQPQRAGIVSYISSVNADQGKDAAELAAASP